MISDLLLEAALIINSETEVCINPSKLKYMCIYYETHRVTWMQMQGTSIQGMCFLVGHLQFYGTKILHEM